MKEWIEAARLRTLPLALSSILMGSACALLQGKFNGVIFVLAIITTVCLQILSNLANDYGDAISGKDNEGRIGPERAVASGKISKEAMKKAVILFAALSFLAGVGLLFVSFKNNFLLIAVFLLLGLAAIWAAIKYTVGKNPYGYNGLGDVFVFLFFGLLGVSGSYFLYTHNFNPLVLLPSVSIGCLSAAVLNLNNMRDMENDAKTGKNTLAVKLGLANARMYQYLLIILGWASLILFAVFCNFELKQYLFLLVLPFFVQMVKSIIKIHINKDFDPFLKKTALGTFVLSILFMISAII